MAENCIVCLGDLVGLADGHNPPSSSGPQPAAGVTARRNSPRRQPPSSAASAIHHDPETIAHLLPCNHNLHHECLKPWVERANSCPICRQNFNQVELWASLEGPCLDSYAVQDKVQTADVDPSIIIDDFFDDEPITEACLICEGTGDEEVLLLCDGCQASCHTYCVGLRRVPAGPWFCQFCQEDGTARDATHTTTTARPRTRRQQRRNNAVARNCVPSEWTRVWQSVWNRLNLDLDFPFDEETETSAQDEAHRRDFEEWQRRFRIAERQGGAARFRDTAQALLDIRTRNNRQATPQAESQEELRAWNAFDKAQELEAAAAASSPPPQRPNGRKRKSTTPPRPSAGGSPMPAPERRLKRPRTRRVQSTVDAGLEGPSNSNAKTPNGVHANNHDLSGASTPKTRDATGAGPTFLQSLLQEVEGSSTPEGRGRNRLSLALGQNGSHSPARSLSPASSPRTSPPNSPRLQSASPLQSPRSGSPPPLTSRIEPIFNRQPHAAYSPASPSARRPSVESDAADEPVINTSESKTPNGDSHNDPPKDDVRRNLDYNTKNEIQALVAAALKPAYKAQAITADQFTDINKEVSRRLYETLPGVTVDCAEPGTHKSCWAERAGKEVSTELKKLRIDVSAFHAES